MKVLAFLAAESRPQMARWAPLALRLMVGYGFMEHGYAKLARGSDSFSHILQALGVPMPELLAWATILVELFGGARAAGCVHTRRQYTDGCGAPRRHRHRPSPKRVQFDQAGGRDRRRAPFRPAGLRDGPPLFRLPCRPDPGRGGPLVDR